MKKTTQIGLRLETDLLRRIEGLAKDDCIDKMSWIKRALASFVLDEEDEMASSAIEDYINLRIDEQELLKYVEFKKIPSDIQEARKSFLKQIVSRKKE